MTRVHFQVIVALDVPDDVLPQGSETTEAKALQVAAAYREQIEDITLEGLDRIRWTADNLSEITVAVDAPTLAHNDLFLGWIEADNLRSAVEARIEATLPKDTSRIEVLDQLVADAGGRATPLGYAIYAFSIRQRIIARRLEARTDVRPAPWE